MVAGADRIDDMAILRHGGMGRVFDRASRPSTLGSFLREFTFGHVRQLDAVASRFLSRWPGSRDCWPGSRPGIDRAAGSMVDIDDTIIEVHGHAKQGAGYGYSGVRGLNALLATLTTPTTAPVIVAQRLRKGRGRVAARRAAAGRRRAETTRRRLGRPLILVRMDSAFYGRGPVTLPSPAAPLSRSPCGWTKRSRRRSPPSIDDAWTTIEYTDAVFDETTGRWISRAEVAEIRSPRSPPRRRPTRSPAGWSCAASRTSTPRRTGSRAETLFDIWRFHAFFTTTDPAILDTVAADKTHRASRDHRTGPRRPEELRAGAPALGPVHGQRRLAGLAVIAFNLTRAAAHPLRPGADAKRPPAPSAAS